MLYRVIHDEPDLTGVPDGIVELVREAFHKNPDERPTATGLLLRLLGDAEPMADQYPAIVRALGGWRAGAAGVDAAGVDASSPAAAPGGIRLTKSATGPRTARQVVPAGTGTGTDVSDHPTLFAGSTSSGASGRSGAVASGDDPAGELSGLEPVVAPPGGGRSPSLPGRRGSRILPGLGAARRADRSKRLAPAIVALVAMVALAGVTVPLALRASDRGTYLTSDGQGLTGGATVEAPPGKGRNVRDDGETTGGGDVPSPGGANAIGAAGRGPVRSGQSRPAGGTTSGQGGASPSNGGAGQSAGPGQSADSGQSNGSGQAGGVQPGGGGNTGGGHEGDSPALHVPGTPGMRVVSVSGGVQVTITAPSDGGTPSTYVVTADPGGTKSLSSPGTVTIQVDGCARTTVRASASNAAGTSPAATSTALGCVQPSVPRDVTVTKVSPSGSDPTGDNLVTWASPAETGGAGVVVDYIVRVYMSANNTISVNTYTVTGSNYRRTNSAGRDPYFKITVAARNPAGQSAEVIGYGGSVPTDTNTVTP